MTCEINLIDLIIRYFLYNFRLINFIALITDNVKVRSNIKCTLHASQSFAKQLFHLIIDVFYVTLYVPLLIYMLTMI